MNALTNTLSVTAALAIPFLVQAPLLDIEESVTAGSPLEAVTLVCRDCLGHRSSFAGHFRVTSRGPSGAPACATLKVTRLSSSMALLIKQVDYASLY